MFWYVYVLESIAKGVFYIGCTHNLPMRLAQHNRGLNLSTAFGRPWRLIHYEAYRNVKDARRRERCLKTSQGSRLLKRMLKEYFYAKTK